MSIRDPVDLNSILAELKVLTLRQVHPRLAVDLIVASAGSLVVIKLIFLQQNDSILLPELSFRIPKMPCKL